MMEKQAAEAAALQAVVSAYATANGVDEAQVAAGLDGDEELEFDSLIALELSVAVGVRLGIEIPAEECARAENLTTLRGFATMVERRLAGGASGHARAKAAS